MPRENTYYTQELHGPFETYDIGTLTLEDGGTLNNATLGYSTMGKLNGARDNAILIPTWYTGTSKIMEQIYIGENHALDPREWFIITVNQLGSGLGSSPHNTPAPLNGPHFPPISIGDDVRAQHRLVTEKFGISELALVFGGSMGAMQTYEWAVAYPDMVKRAAPLAGMAKCPPHAALLAQVFADMLRDDPHFDGGEYDDPARLENALRRMGDYHGVVGLCPAFFAAEAWRGLGFSSLNDFIVQFMQAYYVPMDANNLLCQIRKWQRGDVSRHAGGDLAAALSRIRAQVTVMPIETDAIFPPSLAEAEARLIAGARFEVIHSQCGHLGLFATEPEYMTQIDTHLRALLAR